MTNWVSSSIKSIPQNITGQLALTSHWLDYFTWPHLTTKVEVDVLLGHHEQNWDLVSKEDKDKWWVSKQQCLPREFGLFSPVYSFPPWEKSSQSLAIAQSPRDQLWTVWEVMDTGVNSVTTEALRTDRESRLLLPRERKLNKGRRRTSSWPGRAGRDQIEGWNRDGCWLRLPVLRGIAYAHQVNNSIWSTHGWKPLPPSLFKGLELFFSYLRFTFTRATLGYQPELVEPRCGHMQADSTYLPPLTPGVSLFVAYHRLVPCARPWAEHIAC